jgi:uncharacterized protein (DUF58 family)
MHAQDDPSGGEHQRTPLLDRADIQVLERLSVESLDAIVAGIVGQREGAGQTEGFEFADYRRYIPGDDVRRIDWNIYARLRELHIRTAPQEASLALSVLLDASRSMDSGEPSKLRFGRRLSALLAAVALLRSDAVEIHMLSDGNSVSSGSFDSGAGVLGAMAEELERLPSGRTTELATSIRRSRRSGWEPEAAVLISDGLVAADDLTAAVAALAASARTATFVHVASSTETAGTWEEGSTVLVDSETGRRIEATITPEVRARYATSYARFSAQLEHQCRARGVRYVKADASVDPLEFLLGAARVEILVRVAPSS